MQNGEFEKLLIEAIDESFSSLGESPKARAQTRYITIFSSVLLRSCQNIKTVIATTEIELNS